jgi:glycosyltransferase involved in cell wall biosynthesis
LLPAAIAASVLGRTVVFDVHENVPGQLRTKAWIPAVARRPLAWIAGRLLRVAEGRMGITLAEAGYAELFAGSHPVFPNYLAGEPPPLAEVNADTGVVYLGDVTEARGLAVAVEAAVAAGVGAFTIMGRCSPDFQEQLFGIAAGSNLTLKFRAFVTPDEALRVTAAGVVGLSPLLDSPNYRESLPTKVLEYLAVGIPTLASDLPGTRAVVGGKPGVVLVPPGDVAAWADAIRKAIANDDLRTAAGQGSTVIKQEYVWPADEVRAFYAALA